VLGGPGEGYRHAVARSLQPDRGQGGWGISTSIRGVIEEQAAAFHLGFHDEKEDDELYESEPSIAFKRTR
jgi:hypothetical protein